MVVTPFALIVLLAGLILLVRGSLLAMFSAFLVATMFNGSAAFILAAAGGSSIPPAQFLLGFVVLRLVLPGPGQMQRFTRAVWESRYLIAFVAYAVVSAVTLPIIFARKIEVTPLKPIPGADLFATVPLHMTAQNLTTAFYMVGTLFAGIAAAAAMERPDAGQRLVRLGSAIAVTHAALGISSVLLAGTAWDRVLSLFRNGNYAQLNQSFDGVVRMSGVSPETSQYAAYGAIWCIFMLELWFRDIAPKRTGLAGLVLLLALLASTSSTAYVSLAAYALFVSIRFVLGPLVMPARKQLTLLATALAGVAMLMGAFVLAPGLAGKAGHILQLMTTDKLESGSGIQRSFWAKQGLSAFVESYGLGIGAGSFRSSSVLTAILGSMGVVGVVTFAAHLMKSVRPFGREFLGLRSASSDRAVGSAAGTTALLMLAPMVVGSPSPDPGILWGVMCGVAIALRPAPRPQPDHLRAGYAIA
jgi:hypothetical protein